MKRLGMIVRADHGGLAAQTVELARFLQPEKVLLVDLGAAGRGATNGSRLDGLSDEIRETKSHPLDRLDVEWLLRDVETVFTCETAYHDKMHAFCQAQRKRLVIQANPELHTPHRSADVIVNPTTYGADRLDWPLLPVPVNSRHLKPRVRREPAKVFLHLKAPAAKDRNGTADVAAALRFVKTPITLRVNGPLSGRPTGAVTIEQIPPVENWWENYTDDVDVLIMPRRYAGLCLPAQEAAGAGIPTIALDTVPLRDSCVTVPARVKQMTMMAGGRWPIYGCEPRALARTIDLLATDTEAITKASIRATEWAESLSWDNLREGYEAILR